MIYWSDLSSTTKNDVFDHGSIKISLYDDVAEVTTQDDMIFLFQLCFLPFLIENDVVWLFIDICKSWYISGLRPINALLIRLNLIIPWHVKRTLWNNSELWYRNVTYQFCEILHKFRDWCCAIWTFRRRQKECEVSDWILRFCGSRLKYQIDRHSELWVCRRFDFIISTKIVCTIKSNSFSIVSLSLSSVNHKKWSRNFFL